MIAVIQCASRKKASAGHIRTRDGRQVMFVANPDAAPAGKDFVHARPEDRSDTGQSWRTALERYNEDPGDNPYGLLPAWQLYERTTYRILRNRFGLNRLYILSAGWGLIRADFLTPYYDITFSAARNVAPFKRRHRHDFYRDFRMLPPDASGPILFFGGKRYVPFFCELTADATAPRYVFYNSARAPVAPGCVVQRFDTRARTNWHYGCAEAFVDGRVQLQFG